MLDRVRLAIVLTVVIAASAGCTVGFQDPTGDDDTTESGSPVLADLGYEADYRRFKLEATFSWSDPQSNVREGSFHVYLDGELHETYDLPDTSVTLLSGDGEFRTDLTPFTGDTPAELGLELEDVDGNLSERLTGVIELGREFHTEQEPNDTPGGGQQLATVTPPAAIVGDLTELSGEGDGDYTGDVDFYRFALEQGGNLEFTLYWPTNYNDLGMFLLQAGSQEPWIEADDHTLEPPEEMAAPLTSGTSYTVAVAGSSGEPTGYVLLLDAE